MIRLDVEVKGVTGAIRAIRWTAKDAQLLSTALIRVSRRILDGADQLVPVVTGNLRATGKIKNRSINGGFGAEVITSYGGKPGNDRSFPFPQVLSRKTGGEIEVRYAEEVHNRSSSPQYLERSFKQQFPTIEREVREQVQKVYLRKRARR